MKPRLAILASHVIQYQVPIYRELSQLPDLDVHVFYQSRAGLDEYFVDDFQSHIKWDRDLESGYPHTFLKNYGRSQFGGFLSRVNPALFSLLNQRGFDAVLIQGYSTFSDLLGLCRSRWGGLRVLFKAEGVLEGRKANPALKRIMKRVYLERWLRSCDMVFYDCERNRAYYKHYKVRDSSLRFLPSCVDNDYFRSEAERLRPYREHIRERYGIEKDDIVVAFSARLVPLKRPRDLVLALEKLNRNNIVALFIGSGPEMKVLKELANRSGVRSVFTGFVNQTEIVNCYAISDVLAVLSEYDPSPRSVQEAMNFGIPIIATDTIGTVGDLVIDRRNANVVSRGDVEGIARRLSAIVDDPSLRKELGARAAEDVKCWSPASAARSVQQVLGKLCVPQ